MSDPQCMAQLVGAHGTRCPYPAHYVQIIGGAIPTLRFCCGVHRTRRGGLAPAAVAPAWTDLDPSWLPVLIEATRQYLARLVEARRQLHAQAADRLAEQREAEAALRTYQAALVAQEGT